MSEVLRIRLSGEDAHLGAVPASDVAKLLLGVERAVARAAGEVIRRPVRSRGRWAGVIEAAVRFRLVGIEEGSLVTVLEVPAREIEPDTLGLEESGLGELGLALALRTAAGEGRIPEVAAQFVKLADQVGVGSRYETLTFESELDDAPRQVVLDAAARERLGRVAASAAPNVRSDALVGVLVEADFERFTARLRAPDGQAAAVTFDEELADDIQEALRRPAEVVGEVRYDPETSQAISVDVRAITRAEELAMHLQTGEFWRDVTIEELQAEHSIGPVSAEVELGDPALTDEEADAFLAALDS